MSVNVNIDRIFPPNFFISANDDNFQISSSEKLAKAILVVAKGINEDDIRKGDPQRHEPDLVIENNTGVEVTFASNRNGLYGSNILRLKKGNHKINELETDLIDSISDSINEKSGKKNNGNYNGVNNVSLLVINLDPLLLWYGDLHGINQKEGNDLFSVMYNNYIQKTLSRRDDFFDSIYSNYIGNDIFENIFILQMTEFKTFIFFDIKNFSNNEDNCMVEIGSNSIYKFPHCIVTATNMTEDLEVGITYHIHNIIMEMSKTS
jgi:hypothetical protein